MSGDTFDPSQWEVVASGTEQGQREIERSTRHAHAAQMIARPLVYILGVLFELGLLGDGKTFEIPVRTPSQQISITIKVEPRSEGK